MSYNTLLGWLMTWRKARIEIDALRGCIIELEATPVPPTFAVVAAVNGDKPLSRRDAPAPPAPMSTNKKPMPIKPQVAPTMVPATAPPATQVAGPSDTRAMSKDKGKNCALLSPYIDEVPAGIPSYEEDPYEYNLVFDDHNFNNDYTTDYATMLMSNTVDHVAVILSGTAPVGNSASSSRVGGEPAVLCPETLAEFRLTMDAMEAAHH